MKRRRPVVADIDVRSMLSSTNSTSTPMSSTIRSTNPFTNHSDDQLFNQSTFRSTGSSFGPPSPSNSSHFSLPDLRRSTLTSEPHDRLPASTQTPAHHHVNRSFAASPTDGAFVQSREHSSTDSVKGVFQVPLDRMHHYPTKLAHTKNGTQPSVVSNQQMHGPAVSQSVMQTPKSINSSYAHSRSGSYSPSISHSISNSVSGSVSMSVAREGSTIVSICELRAGGVVGVCCIDPSRAEILISQLNDSRTYNATMLAIYQFDPSLIIVPDTAVESALVSFIQAERALSHANIHAAKRRTFNENTGISSLELYCTPESLAAVHIESSKYLCLAAVAAAMKYLEEEEGIRFVPLSLRLRETTLDELTRIDLKTALSLELVSVKVQPAKNKRGQEPKNKPVTSIFDVLNHCTTVAGARLLRSSLLQPFRDVGSIEARLEGVEELLGKPELVAGLSTTLCEFSTFDKTVTASLVRTQTQATLSARNNHITHLLQLRAAVKCCDSLNSQLVRCTSELFRSMIGVLIDDSSAQIVSIIDQIIDVNANHTRSGQQDQRHTMVFALLPNLSSYLDTSRHIYSDTLSDLQQEAARITQECLAAMSEDIEDDEAAKSSAAPADTKTTKKSSRSRPNCSLEYSTAKGYHLAVDNKVFEKQQRLQQQSGPSRSNSSVASTGGSSSLGSTQFISLGTRGRTQRLVTTPALNSLNSRHEEAFAEVMKLSHVIVEQALEKMRKFLPWLLTLSDEIAILDLLLSFVNACTAQAAAANQAATAGSAVAALTAAIWTRPVLTKSGPIALKSARHPLLNHRLGPARCVPNDAFLSETSNVAVLTGINMSGKSAYLRSIGTLTILAQIGCYLPAEYASVRICDEIIARWASGSDCGTAPLMSTGAATDSTSTLFREMHDLSSVLARLEQLPKTRALLLFDEPARATDPTEGSSLAFAVAEHLSFHSSSYTMVTTHYHSLTRLGDMYPNVQNLRTDSSIDGELHMISQFRVNDGACDDSTHYGVRVAAMCGMPRTITDLAKQVLQTQDEDVAATRGIKRPGSSTRKRRARHELLDSLLSLRHATLNVDEVRNYLIQARNENMSKHRRRPSSNDTADIADPASPSDASVTEHRTHQDEQIMEEADENAQSFTNGSFEEKEPEIERNTGSHTLQTRRFDWSDAVMVSGGDLTSLDTHSSEAQLRAYPSNDPALSEPSTLTNTSTPMYEQLDSPPRTFADNLNDVIEEKVAMDDDEIYGAKVETDACSVKTEYEGLEEAKSNDHEYENASLLTETT